MGRREVRDAGRGKKMFWFFLRQFWYVELNFKIEDEFTIRISRDGRRRG